MDHPDLVIFDCDGVLVDSECISIGLLVETIRGIGGDIGEEAAYARFLGRSMTSISAVLLAEHGLVFTEAQHAAFRTELFRRFESALKPVAGVAAVLAALSGRRCVASSSSVERIRFSLHLTGLLALLEPWLYSASMVERGKPEPDLFLHAARAMGVRPERCLVVEDSPAGVDAARRAGMRVFGFAGASHASKAALARRLQDVEPDLVFYDMLRLPALLGVDAVLPPAAR